jgi:hypothetical protein
VTSRLWGVISARHRALAQLARLATGASLAPETSRHWPQSGCEWLALSYSQSRVKRRPSKVANNFNTPFIY